MSQNKFEDRGIKGSKIRLSNNSWFVSSSFDNKSDIPVFRVNEANQIEFADLPYVKDIGRLSVGGSSSGGDGNGQGYFLAEKFTITSTMIATKSLTLQKTPSTPANVMILPSGGPAQTVEANDFTVNGNIISWAGKNLDGLLSVNDKVTVLVPF